MNLVAIASATLALALVACGGEATEPTDTSEAAVTAPDCSAAICTRATYTPVTGGIEAGQGLPHLGCFVSVPGCFDQACRTTPADRAWCGSVAMIITHPTP